ncbi:hypothetical protein FAVG1_11241 [Fusarium avenaceum]|nr:hypothetical protein FAVG1_11241 [Fusarium avenaceum]
MTKHSRLRKRASHMHPYRRERRKGHSERCDKSGRDSSPQADPPQASTSVDDDDDDDGNKLPPRPQPELFGQLRILPSAAISLAPDFVVRNPRKTGSQTDICARVPGRFNTWVARVSCRDTLFDFQDLVLLNSGRKSPHFYGVWVHGDQIYTIRKDEQKMQLNNHADCNLIFWTNGSDTSTEKTELKGSIIPIVLGDEGMKMVVQGVVEESSQWEQ